MTVELDNNEVHHVHMRKMGLWKVGWISNESVSFRVCCPLGSIEKRRRWGGRVRNGLASWFLNRGGNEEVRDESSGVG